MASRACSTMDASKAVAFSAFLNAVRSRSVKAPAMTRPAAFLIGYAETKISTKAPSLRSPCTA